jgi:hypothetical protein|tara:strand:+ start:2108 stop:2338 length:231 start_codon:yes stop_codon:yes gene_type:complete
MKYRNMAKHWIYEQAASALIIIRHEGVDVAEGGDFGGAESETGSPLTSAQRKRLFFAVQKEVDRLRDKLMSQGIIA